MTISAFLAATPMLPSQEYWRLSFIIIVSALSLQQMLLMLETLSFLDIIDSNALLFELSGRNFTFVVYGIICPLTLML